jgi:hypothetical protein
MLKFSIILAVWITPGILLLLYLLWVSKRHRRASGNFANLAAPQVGASSEISTLERELSQPAVSPARVVKRQDEELEVAGARGSR